ncbi:unnamed protein product [Ectocarpus sp. CCAP 1310/34]|nr:unnamed protein product [Ectocarpus sp. CCAP 1310/34]
MNRVSRFNRFANGDLSEPIAWLMMYEKNRRLQYYADTEDNRQRRATRLAHESGGVTKAANALISPAPSPRNNDTLEHLRNLHPNEDPDDIATAWDSSIKAAGDRIKTHKIDSVAEADEPFEIKFIKQTVKKANPQSAPGPDGLRFSYLQAGGMSDFFTETLADFSFKVFYYGDELPDFFWNLHTSANLSALGEKKRPIAVGGVLRRIISGSFCHQYKGGIANIFEAANQFGGGVPGGVEIVASTAALSHQQGSTILSFDGKNAYNSMRRSSILPAVATHTPHLAKYFGNIYARTKAKLLFKMEDGSIEVVLSQRGVQQGCNLGGFGFCVGLLDIMKEFNNKPPVPGAKLIGYVDDLQVHLPPGLARNIQAIATVTNWIQDHLLQKGIELSLPKSKVLFPEGLFFSSLTNDEQRDLTKTGLSVAEGGMAIVGVPVGTECFQRSFVTNFARGNPAELIRRLSTLDDPQASYQLLRLSGVPRLFHLLRTIAPSITNTAAREHDNLMIWAVSKIVLGKMANTVGIPTVEEVRANPEKSEVDFFKDSARAQVHLPIREGGLGITSSVLIRESAFVAGQALVFSKGFRWMNGCYLTSIENRSVVYWGVTTELTTIQADFAAQVHCHRVWNG